jgi:hypothetical protein
MAEKRERDPVTDNETLEGAPNSKKARTEPGAWPSPAFCDQPRIVHFMTLWEDPNLSVYTFDRDSTPEGEVIYAELMKLWRIDDRDRCKKGYPKMLLNETLIHFVEPVLAKDTADRSSDNAMAFPEALLAVKDWGTWSYTSTPFGKSFHGECVLFHSWC